MDVNYNKNLSLWQKKFFDTGLVGILFLLYGVSNIFGESIMLKFLLPIVVLIIILLRLKFRHKNTDTIDEMADYHQNKASDFTTNLLLLVITSSAIYSVFVSSWNVDLAKILPFIVAAYYLLDFLVFFVFEYGAQYD